MADYTTIAKVKAILPGGMKIDDQTSDPPSEATVSTMIALGTKQIDTAVAKGGGTPQLTGDAAGEADLMLQREVAFQSIVIRGGLKSSKEEPEWDKWHDEFVAYLERLSGVTAAAAGTPAVAGAPRTNTPEADPWFTRDGVDATA